jgi:transcriptional regulator with XRE-family HTH domain
VTEFETLDSDTALDDKSISIALGRTITAARSALKRSMRTVAADAGISQPFLSQIENGHTMPSVLTLYRIAGALQLSPAELMPTAPQLGAVHVVRGDEARVVRVSEEPNSAFGRLLTTAGAPAMVTEYRVQPTEDLGDWFESDGELVVYVAEGDVLVTLHEHGSWELSAGDAIAYPGRYRNVWSVRGDRPATIVLVHSPSP